MRGRDADTVFRQPVVTHCGEYGAAAALGYGHMIAFAQLELRKHSTVHCRDRWGCIVSLLQGSRAAHNGVSLVEGHFADAFDALLRRVWFPDRRTAQAVVKARGNIATGLQSDGFNIATATKVSLIGNICRDFKPIASIYDAAGNNIKDGTHPDCIQLWSEAGQPRRGTSRDLLARSMRSSNENFVT